MQVIDFTKLTLDELNFPAFVNALNNPKTGHLPAGVYEDFHLIHPLVKTTQNRWHVICGDVIGQGSFGTVQETLMVVEVQLNKKNQPVAKIVAANDVAKIQKPSPTQTLESLYLDAIAEGTKQAAQGVRVCKPIKTYDSVITITENCGMTLERFFKHLNSSHDFNFRFQVAASIANEINLLRQNEFVHRDLKPANICFRKLPNGGFQVILIDFGLAEITGSKGNEDFAGTLAYMAPELLLQTSPSSPASDIYVLACLFGQLFGATDILKYKKQAGTERGLARVGYCYEGIFENYNMNGIDEELKRDFKELLLNLENADLDKRPTLDVILKFILMIPNRQKTLSPEPNHSTDSSQIYSDLVSSCKLLGIWDEKHNTATDITIRHTIDKFNLRPEPLSLLTLAKQTCAGKMGIDPETLWSKTRKLNVSLSNANTSVKDSLKKFQLFEETLLSDKFNRSNSSGIKDIKKIMNSSKSYLEKIQCLQKLGHDKTHGLLATYSRSHFFGQGRHANMEKLYSDLAKLDVNAPIDNLIKQIQVIDNDIQVNTFVHRPRC